MKYLSSCLLFMLTAIGGKAQKIDSAAVASLSPELKQQVNNYLIAARKAKTTAMIMSIGGGTLAVAGGVMVSAAAVDGIATMWAPQTWDKNPNKEPDAKSSLANTGMVMLVVGAASTLGSIPFFIKVRKKHTAARAIVFADKGMPFTTNILMPRTRSAGIGLVIALGAVNREW